MEFKKAGNDLTARFYHWHNIIMGLGDSLIKDENPLTTMLRYAVTISALNIGLGAVGAKNMLKSNK